MALVETLIYTPASPFTGAGDGQFLSVNGILWTMNSGITIYTAVDLASGSVLHTYTVTSPNLARQKAVDQATNTLYGQNDDGNPTNHFMRSYDTAGNTFKYNFTTDITVTGSGSLGAIDSSTNTWFPNGAFTSVHKISSYNSGALTATYTAVSPSPFSTAKMLANGGQISGRMYFVCQASAGTKGVGWFDIATDAVTNIYNQPSSVTSVGVVSPDSFVFVADNDATNFTRLVKMDQDGSIITTAVMPALVTAIFSMAADGIDNLWMSVTQNSVAKIMQFSRTTLALIDSLTVTARTMIGGFTYQNCPLIWNTGTNAFAVYQVTGPQAAVSAKGNPIWF